MVPKGNLVTAIIFSILGGALIGFLTHWSMTFNDHERNPKAECVYAIVQNPTNEGSLPECVTLSDADKRDLLNKLTYFELAYNS